MISDISSYRGKPPGWGSETFFFQNLRRGLFAINFIFIPIFSKIYIKRALTDELVSEKKRIVRKIIKMY